MRVCVSEVLGHMDEAGYRLIFLTARPISAASATRHLLGNIGLVPPPPSPAPPLPRVVRRPLLPAAPARLTRRRRCCAGC